MCDLFKETNSKYTMTAQFPEKIIYQVKMHGMASEPLHYYLRELEEPIKTSGVNTACWRGYIGTWELRDNKLYLIDLKTKNSEGMDVGIEYVFPGKQEVFADWYSGEIRIPQGQLLSYVHRFYDSVYERDILLMFGNGCLVNTRTVDNKKDFIENMKIEAEKMQKEKEVRKGFWKRLFP